MSYPGEIWRRLRSLGRGSRFHAELNEEMQFHMESRVDELVQSGVPRDVALLRAKREFGSGPRVAEDARSSWEFRWFEDLLADLAYAQRALRRNPGFALAAISCLALGIGADSTIFSVTTSFLLSVPSARDPESLISIQAGGNSSSTVADYKFLRNARIFESTAGTNPERDVNWRNGDESLRLHAASVTDDYFVTLGAPFELGRGIEPGETNTVVLSYRFWSGRFGRDASIAGRHVVLDGKPYTVVGVLPADHRNIVGYGFSPDIYVPVLRDDEYVQFYARLPGGMGIPAARERLRVVLGELDRIHPIQGWKRDNSETHVAGVAGMDILGSEQAGPVIAFFGMLLIVVALVLLVACTNVAGLLLARASARSHELAVRLSLGASRGRVVRHLLAESLLLSLLGAAAGLLIDVICGRLISNLTLPLPVPIQLVIKPDGRLLWYSIGLVLASSLLSGLMPALRAVRRDVNVILKREQRAERTWGLRGALIAGQIAVSTVLLATGFLFLHNLRRAVSMNPGFDTKHTVWASMRLVPEDYKDPSRQRSLVEEALNRLRSLPGAEAVAVTRRVPLNDNCKEATNLRTDLSPASMPVTYECNDVGPDYFRAIGIPLLRGREFTADDRAGSPAVAIVNESFARLIFGARDPVGHTVTTWGPIRIVGVVRDSRYFTLGEKPHPALYIPYLANDEPVALNFIVRASGSPAALVKPVADLLGRLDAGAAVETKPLIRSMGLALLPSQVGAAMLGTMGVLGLVLAAIGLYGALLYSVSRRTREIGVRVALGASSAAVLRLVCRHSFGLTAIGLAIGLIISAFATRPLAMFLVPGLSTADPAALVGVVAVFGAIAALATLVPAVKALRVEPISALRYE